ncbi:septal ring lytic transglycosylase RlpA family protein [Salinisphaera sp. SPP-AMP-43]|uniref:septal ring lytic transglycosylase RlpA family protein n=1 Tax=Salinisphaera sp. SPP-AMP-43 TaxID=3121288 RepID=UPI003C6DEE9C
MNRLRLSAILAVLAAITLIAGCASTPPSQSKGGGYYQNDGPPDQTDIDLSQYPDAIPKNAPKSKYGNPTSYTALGKRYYVLKSADGFTQTGRASWYGRQFDGGRTSSGEPYNMFAMTAAHKRLPIPSWVQVTNLDNHRQVVVKVNDRGPFHKGRIIDLSYVAARRLGIVGAGSAPVRIRTVTPGSVDQAKPPAANDPPPSAPLRRAQNPPDSADPTRPSRTSQPARPAAAASETTAPARASSLQPSGELQIGAFSSAARADRARDQARAAGIDPVSVVPPSPDMKLYRVRVGPFDTSAARYNARQQLADAGFPVREVKR